METDLMFDRRRLAPASKIVENGSGWLGFDPEALSRIPFFRQQTSPTSNRCYIADAYIGICGFVEILSGIVGSSLAGHLTEACDLG